MTGIVTLNPEDAGHLNAKQGDPNYDKDRADD